MKLTFLAHSGFMIDDGTRCYVFDYYQDPADVVKKAEAEGRTLWFFVTHDHGDHFAPDIGRFAAERYFIHKDVPTDSFTHVMAVAEANTGGTEQLSEVVGNGRVTLMEVGDTVTVEGIEIRMFGSTDAGGSFAVRLPEGNIFHAGDLNWWHWVGDTRENNREARANTEREFAKLKGESFDVVFFPVDARLEEAREWGVLSFLEVVKAEKLLVSMHHFGEAWAPSPYFKACHEALPLWIPSQCGEEFDIVI